MGALVVLDYLLHYPQGLRGAIISGAPIELGGTANPLLIAIARILSVVWPRASFSLNLDGAKLSRDPNVVKTRADDPLRSRMASVRWGTEFLRTVAWVKTHAAEIKIPILLIHGGDDRINPVQGTRYLCETISSADKTLRIYPGGYHEPHNDIDHQKVAADIQEWLDRHL
jgi:alpha-beta hydrolase superfamily lysophospholipase